jgi:hypothetical protein
MQYLLHQADPAILAADTATVSSLSLGNVWHLARRTRRQRQEHGPYHFSLVSWCGAGDATPFIAERANDVQPTAGFSEVIRSSEGWGAWARVGDGAKYTGPGLQQTELNRPSRTILTRSWQRMAERVGQQLGHDDPNILAAFCHTPLPTCCDGEISGRAD